MRRIAPILGVHPTDLLESAALAELAREIEPVAPKGLANVTKALIAHHQMRLYRVLADNLVDCGITAGKVFLADESTQGASQLKTGAIVVLELRARHSPTVGYLVPRVFIEPDLFVTNRPGSNLSMKLNDLSIAVKIIGVMVPDSLEDGH